MTGSRGEGPEAVIIAAMTPDRVLGADNQIPWHVPEDLKHFKRTTRGHSIIMGRLTWESLGRALPGRRNMIISRSMESAPPGTELFPSLAEAIRACRGELRVFITGGAGIYREALEKDLADTMILSMMNFRVEGSVYFPDWKREDWKLVSTETFEDFSVERYERKR